MLTARDAFERYQRCLLTKDWQGFGELLAEDAGMEFPFAMPGAPARHAGRDAIRTAARDGWSRVPLQFSSLESVVIHDGRDPDRLVAEYELCGTAQPGGAAFRLPVVLVIHMRNGEIAAIREYLHAIDVAGLTGRASALAAHLVAPRSGPSPRALWDAAIDRYLARDIDGYAALFAPDGAMELPFTVPGLPARMTGPDEIRATLGPLWRAAAARGGRTLRCEPRTIHVTCDPDAVVVEFDVHGEDATGAEYRLSYVHAVRGRDGKIALLRDYVDARAIAARIAAAAPVQPRAGG